MNATVKQQYKHAITKVVLETIHPRTRVEIDPADLPAHIGEYGNLTINGQSARLTGVRISEHPHVISYAGNYWRSDAEGRVTAWHLYIGVSHTPGLVATRSEA